MAKRTPKDEGPKWYTATMEPEAMAPGRHSARTIEVEAANEKEVEEALARKGWKWKRITITEGQCVARLPWNKDEEAERYHATLEAMLGRTIPPRHNSGPFPFGYRASAEVKDSDTRKRWAEYLEQWSYGLSVSTLPHHLSVEGGGTIYLPARWAQDARRWDQCTGIVHATLKQWRASRAHMAEHHKGGRTPEARELWRANLAAVKSFDALEGWTFPAFVERLNRGRNPSPFDVPHPGLLDIATAYMVPVMHPDRDHLKLEWWRQLLAAWDGPANTKAATVEQLLDHHHRQGGRAEVFRAMVKSTLKRLHAIRDTGRKGAEHWETLADVLEQWLAKAPKVPKPEKGTTSAKGKPKRPDLKLVALVHALRYLTGEKGADITKDNAQVLAKAAGAMGKDSGRDLRRAYTRYTLKVNSKAERLQDGHAHTVKERYLRAIPMLEDYPEAKAMAAREMLEIRKRE